MSNDIIKTPSRDLAEYVHVAVDGTLQITCGKASIKLCQDGTIVMNGTHLRIDGHMVKLTGEIHLN